MAKVEMCKTRIYGLKKDRKKILRKIQHLGVVEVVDGATLPSEGSKCAKVSSCAVTFDDVQKSIKILDEGLMVVSDAMKILMENLDAAQKKEYNVGPFYEPFVVNESDFEYLVADADKILDVAREVLNEDREISQLKAEILKLEDDKVSLGFWKDLDVPTAVSCTKFTSCWVGTLPPEFDNEDDILNVLRKGLGGKVGGIHVEIVSKTSELAYVFLMCRKNDSDLISKKLLNLGFTSCKYDSSRTPLEDIRFIEGEINKSQARLNELRNNIRDRSSYLQKLRFVYDYYMSKKESYKVIAKLQSTRKAFVLTGYVPKNRADLVESAVHSFPHTFVESESIQSFEESPVLLNNFSAVSAVEPVLESYSLPSKAELDPTFVMSIFYYFLFGLMLSDAGYGAVMSIVCGCLLYKHKNMKSSLKKSLTMFFICGIFTFFWGLMFGSFFGDAIEVVSATFFGRKISTPTFWFVPIKRPMLMLSFSFGVGILHMFTGLFFKFVQLLKSRKYLDAVFDVVSWFLLVGGLVVFMLSVPMVPKLLDINVVIRPMIANISKLFMLVGALTVLFTAGRGSGNFFKRLLKGVYGLYGITNYLSDIISYSRLLALGLSTGVIAQVFNKMGAMGGSNLFGVILFALVFLLGHTVNILINLLGAYVHTNRLQFVEFFSKFYEGGGRKFSPFSFKTKYCDFFGGSC